MLLKRLEIRNVRKVKQADIEFYGPGAQVIQGKNGSGKTTIAQSISLTLNGPKSYAPGMITEGQETAEIIAYTDDGLKIRTILGDTVKQDVFREDGDRYTKVTGGVREFLNSIRSGLETPWEMKDMTDEAIISLLKDKCGISAKVAEVEAKTKQKEQTRTEIGRDIKRMGDIVEVEKVDHAESIDVLKKKKADIDATMSANRESFRQFSDSMRSECNFSSLEEIDLFYKIVKTEHEALKSILSKRVAYSGQDLEDVDQGIADYYDTEKQADAYDAYVLKLAEKEKLETQYADLTKEIETLRDDRKKILAGMKLGIKGLEITEENTLVNNGALRGITNSNKVSNWSTAETVRVLFSIGAVFASDMKMLVVDNAESLDEDTQKIMSDWASKSGFLVVLLKVGEIPEDKEDGVIYVKEGEIVKK